MDTFKIIFLVVAAFACLFFSTPNKAYDLRACDESHDNISEENESDTSMQAKEMASLLRTSMLCLLR